VAGVVQRFGHGFLDLDIPAGHLPPPGECKLWYPKRPAGQPPPPERCDVLMGFTNYAVFLSALVILGSEWYGCNWANRMALATGRSWPRSARSSLTPLKCPWPAIWSNSPVFRVLYE
jgi:hypothetical protein